MSDFDRNDLALDWARDKADEVLAQVEAMALAVPDPRESAVMHRTLAIVRLRLVDGSASRYAAFDRRLPRRSADAAKEGDPG